MLPQTWPAILSLGWILLVIAAAKGMMVLFSLAADDGMAEDFAISAIVTLLVGGACVLTTKGRPFQLRFRDAALLTAIAWFVVPVFGAIPFVSAEIGLTFADAYFESVSGLTTTGATVIAGLDGLPKSLLLWRSTIQWIGGIGIIGLAIVILPFLKIGGMQLFRLEFTDRSDKTMPRVRSIAVAVGEIYLLLTLACFIAYWLLGMTPFDALNHAFTTVCTGGFSTHDASFGHFRSDAIDWTATVFMLAGALPFLAYLQIFHRGPWRQRIEPQILTLFGIVVVASVAFAVWLNLQHGLGGFDATTRAVFSIVSIITTTGYASVDYVAWGTFATIFFFLLSFIGGCSGSTSGGVKVLRHHIIVSIVAQHVRRAIYPNLVQPLRYGTRIIPDEQVASIGTFMFLYFVSFAVIAALLSLLGLDLATVLSATAASLGNVGPGVTEEIGPAGNYVHLPEAAKIILSAAMVIGRLEILGILILFLPSFYR